VVANTFIKRPVTAIVISIVLVITGIICILNLPVGPSVANSVRASDMKAIGQSSFAVLANTISLLATLSTTAEVIAALG